MIDTIKERQEVSKPYLSAEIAEQLMTPQPVSVRAYDTTQNVMKIMIENGLTAVPVVDREGHPIGVLSQTDLIRHERESVHYVSPLHEYYEKVDIASSGIKMDGFQLQKVDATKVSEIMTPVVFSIQPDTPVLNVISEMLTRKIHRIFVVDQNHVLVGVISALDILKKIQE